MVFGTEGIYYDTYRNRWRTKYGPGSILYTEFRTRAFKAESKIEVALGDDHLFDTGTSAVGAQKAVDILDSIQKLADRTENPTPMA